MITAIATMDVGSVAEVETRPLSEVEKIVAQGYRFVEKIPLNKDPDADPDTDLGKYFNTFFTEGIHNVELRLIEEGNHYLVYQRR